MGTIYPKIRIGIDGAHLSEERRNTLRRFGKRHLPQKEDDRGRHVTFFTLHVK